jgi:carbonic anhydrase
MLIHHTDCGLEKVTEEDFARQIELESGAAPSFIIGAFRDAAEDVAKSLVRVRASRYILHRDAVRGFLYDVDTHALREIQAAD